MANLGFGDLANIGLGLGGVVSDAGLVSGGGFGGAVANAALGEMGGKPYVSSPETQYSTIGGSPNTVSILTERLDM